MQDKQGYIKSKVQQEIIDKYSGPHIYLYPFTFFYLYEKFLT